MINNNSVSLFDCGSFIGCYWLSCSIDPDSNEQKLYNGFKRHGKDGNTIYNYVSESGEWARSEDEIINWITSIS